MVFNKVKMTKKIATAALLSCMVLSVTGCKSDDNNNNNNNQNQNNDAAQNINFGLPENVQDGAMIQAWCWDFKTIEENLPDLAAAGFTGVQTVPIQACVDPGGRAISTSSEDKGTWYFHYQPTDFTIGNYQVGTRDEFISLCNEAHKYGMKIIVDMVPNHTGSTEKVADALAQSAGGIDKLYHKNGFNKIKNYGNRLECTSGASGGLNDIDTENDGFQDYFIAFINDCVECGADGFRYDSAKHIALPDDPLATEGEDNDFWPRVTSDDEIKNGDKIFNYGEVLQGDNERGPAYVEYLDAMTASNFGNVVRVFSNLGKIKLEYIENPSPDISSDHLVTWVESHDNYCNDKSYTHFNNDQIAYGWALIAATGKGTPLFFSRPVGSDDKNWAGTLNLVGYKGDENYKNPIVVAANHFRNAMVGEDVAGSNIDGNEKLLLIERGTKGAVIFNGTDDVLSLNTAVKLSDGTYTDRTGICGDFSVSGGTVTGSVPAHGVAILYNDGYIDIPDFATVGIDAENYIYGDDFEITLSCTNASKAEYSVITRNEDGVYDDHNAERTEYTDGTKIKIGSELQHGESLVLKLYATNSDGITSTRAYRLHKKDAIKSGDTIGFVSNNSWGSTVYAYIYYYDENGNKVESSAWPGEAMTHGDGLSYSYTLKNDYKEAYVIFSDGTDANKRPTMKKDTDEGYELESGKIYG